ncbi:hypothetical protein [Clostridium estertheticum]|nr:hypothetical protein [Clostridium estertheticum]
MKIGLETVKPWSFLGDIGAAIQEYTDTKTQYGNDSCKRQP